MSAILTYMKVTPREFIREFPRFRERALQGEPVFIEARNGTKFLFHRVGESVRPRRCPEPLPTSVTDRWELDAPAIGLDEWNINA
jgi:hypothetical protein